MAAQVRRKRNPVASHRPMCSGPRYSTAAVAHGILAVVACFLAILPGSLAFTSAPFCSLGDGLERRALMKCDEARQQLPPFAAGLRSDDVPARIIAGVASAAVWVLAPIAIGNWAVAAEDLSTGPLQLAAEKGNVGIILEGKPRVVDGDTLVFDGILSPDGKKERVRLLGIDAPETKQMCKDSRGEAYKCGVEAQGFLKDMIGKDQVKCFASKRDQYSRVLGVCFDERTGQDLNREMVKAGEALAYTQFSKAYVPEESSPRASRKGVWRGSFDAPWDYRKAKRAGGQTVGGGSSANKGAPQAVASKVVGNSAVRGPKVEFGDPWDDLSEFLD